MNVHSFDTFEAKLLLAFEKQNYYYCAMWKNKIEITRAVTKCDLIPPLVL